ncbi:MAG: ATP-binding protein [Bacteroidota bacterium]
MIVNKNDEMLVSLFKYANEGILVTDEAGKITLANPKAEKMFGYSQVEMMGMEIENLLPPRHRSHHTGYRKEYTQNPEPRSMGKGRELFAYTKNGEEFPIEISISNFKMNDVVYIMCFIADITERKKHQDELKAAHEKLQQSAEAISRMNAELELKVKERTTALAEAIKKLDESRKEVLQALEKEKQLNELKSRFVTTASHEFRTPLGTILSSASLIARYNAAEDEEKRVKHIERIRSSVSNLTEILNDFLSLDKLEEGIIRNNPVEFEIESFISSSLDELKPILKSGQSISFVNEGQTNTIVSLDNQILKNVIINLVSNAIKYSPESSPITVSFKAKGENCKIDVTDRGIGIPEHDQQHIFERFFRANNATNIQGTGLGLNIVKKYVELMKGKISFTSKPSEGTTFTVELPVNKK